MGIHDGHRQRCKQRYLAAGADGLSDHQLLELLLFYAIPRQDTNETAHRLIDTFGSLYAVLTAEPKELASVAGVGENAALLLHLTGELGVRGKTAIPPKTVLSDPRKAGAYFTALLSGHRRELLYQACLDAKGKVLTCHCVTKGTVSASALHVRQLVEDALYAGAVSVILAHNHPSGVALPSSADVAMTRLVEEAMEPLGIKVSDHIIVADGDFVSMAQSGFLMR